MLIPLCRRLNGGEKNYNNYEQLSIHAQPKLSRIFGNLPVFTLSLKTLKTLSLRFILGNSFVWILCTIVVLIDIAIKTFQKMAYDSVLTLYSLAGVLVQVSHEVFRAHTGTGVTK
jgi:hypothetical protein